MPCSSRRRVLARGKQRVLRHAQGKNSNDRKNVGEAEAAQARLLNKISAIFIGGYVLTLTNSTLANAAANVGLDYAYYDEGAFRTENGNARLHDAPEALRLGILFLRTTKNLRSRNLENIRRPYQSNSARGL